MKDYLGILLVILAQFAATAWSHPGSAIAVSNGEVYFVHTAVGVFKVDREGHMSRYAQPGFHFMILDSAGRFSGQRWPRFPHGEVRNAGTNPRLLLASSFPLAIASDGNLYYPQVGARTQVTMMRLVPLGKPTVFATLPAAMEIGADGKPAVAQWIHGLAAGRDGMLYYAEQNAVRRIEPNGSVSLAANVGSVPECNPPAEMSGVPHGPLLRGLAAASDGAIYVAASGCSAVLKITPAGIVSVVLRASDSWSPTALSLSGGDLYVLEYRHIKVERAQDWLPRIRKLSPDGSVALVAEVSTKPE